MLTLSVGRHISGPHITGLTPAADLSTFDLKTPGIEVLISDANAEYPIGVIVLTVLSCSTTGDRHHGLGHIDDELLRVILLRLVIRKVSTINGKLGILRITTVGDNTLDFGIGNLPPTTEITVNSLDHATISADIDITHRDSSHASLAIQIIRLGITPSHANLRGSLINAEQSLAAIQRISGNGLSSLIRGGGHNLLVVAFRTIGYLTTDITRNDTEHLVNELGERIGGPAG